MNNKVIIGFIGRGYVLNKARSICEDQGFIQKYYSNLNKVDCDLLFALRYKKLITNDILSQCPKGVIVIHYGKLPYYKGWYPINQAVLNGESEIGITMFFVNEKIDGGDIIDQRLINIDENETIEKIYQRCNKVAIEMFSENLYSIVNNTINSSKQVGEGSFFGKKDLPSKLEFAIQDIRKFHNQIRSRTGKNQIRFYIEDNKYRLYFEKTRIEKK